MSMTVLKITSIIMFMIGGWILYPQSLLPEEVLFLSLESKTPTGGKVYNKIKFFPGGKKDIWMMNQSHYGLNADSSQWDRLAIVVDNTKPQKTVEFLQLPPGDLKWSEDLRNQKMENKISCFICHTNGPRAIRPDAQQFELNLLSKAQIAVWNYRMKIYGRIKELNEQEAVDLTAKVPFRYRALFDNEPLLVKACTKCHYEKNNSGRGFLTRQNAVTIHFMVANKFMPPSQEELSAKDQEQISKFIVGL